MVRGERVGEGDLRTYSYTAMCSTHTHTQQADTVMATRAHNAHALARTQNGRTASPGRPESPDSPLSPPSPYREKKSNQKPHTQSKEAHRYSRFPRSTVQTWFT